MKYCISYKDTDSFTKLILDYIEKDEQLKNFVSHFPEIENFEKQIKEKKTHQIERDILVDVLKDQNGSFLLSEKSKTNINLLRDDNTFSVTTGHQLCLFTGPVYFLYKIISTINLCENLAEKYPNYNFIPIFWMASEDHDFEEINHINYINHKIKWSTKQKGSVGRMDLGTLNHVISELKLVLGNHIGVNKLILLFEKAYLKFENLADATRFLVNELFGEYGLVIIDGDDKSLKTLFIPQIIKDTVKSAFAPIIRECSSNLSKYYKQQAFVRDINFFRLTKGKRELITGTVTENEVLNSPETFSPNVLLRPLYQEVLLPNIAYVGGESEISYWMQLKTVFDHEKIPFPILVLRNSVLLIDKKRHERFMKLGFKLKDLFLSKDVLNRIYLINNSKPNISLESDKKELKSLYENLVSKTSDSSLSDSIASQFKKQLSFLDNLQAKLIKSEKTKNESAVNQISKIKKSLFPNNILQERHDNYIFYYLDHGDNFIKILKQNLDPLSSNFVILII